MSAWEKRLAELALEAVEKICTECKDQDKLKSFKSRARSLVSDMYSSGTAYVVSVTAARSSAAAVEIGLRARSLDDILRLCSDEAYSRKLGLDGSEDVGYAIYGALLLHALKEMHALSADRLSDTIRKLWGNTLAERVALRVATWLKRFAEAYIHD